MQSVSISFTLTGARRQPKGSTMNRYDSPNRITHIHEDVSHEPQATAGALANIKRKEHSLIRQVRLSEESELLLLHEVSQEHNYSDKRYIRCVYRIKKRHAKREYRIRMRYAKVIYQLRVDM